MPGDGEVGVPELADKDPLLASAVSGVPPAGPARKLRPIVLGGVPNLG